MKVYSQINSFKQKYNMAYVNVHLYILNIDLSKFSLIWNVCMM